MKTNRFFLLTVSIFLARTLLAANVAVIDSGVDYKHDDLAAKMWKNSASQTVDKDGKVYQEDTYGWNFAESNNQVIDYKYLGTFSADCTKIFDVQGKILLGTATAEEKEWYKTKKSDAAFLKELSKFGNFVHGTHVSGIASKDVELSKIIAVKLIATEPPGGNSVKFLNALMRPLDLAPQAADNALAKLFLGLLAKQQAKMFETIGKYTAAVKADVANGSFGVSTVSVAPLVKQLIGRFLGHEPSEQEVKDYSQYLVEQIVSEMKTFAGAAPDTLFVFAAGNDGTDNDSLAIGPGNLKADNTIAVAATQGGSKLASFSNFGTKMVEVAAPGVVIKSSIPGGHLNLSGTSMAAPFVANVASNVKDQNRALRPVDVKRILMETVDVKDFLRGKVTTSGIVNGRRATRAALLSKNMSLDEALSKAKTEIGDLWTAEDSFADGIAEEDVIVVPLPNPLVDSIQ